MYKKLSLLVFVSLLLFFWGHAFAGPDINPGKWEITTSIQMAGIPSQSVTHTQCITDEDLVPVKENPNQECRVEDIQINGNTVSWEITCKGQGGGMTGTGEVTYNGDTMNGSMEMNISGANMQVKNTFTGRRIGECDSSGQDGSSM